MESILTSVKKICGIAEEYEAFDVDIIMHINSVFMILYQIGVGPSSSAFRIKDKSAVWSDFIPETDPNYESVKSYVSLRVRLFFDPPTSSTHIECMKQLVSELEWRLYTENELESR